MDAITCASHLARSGAVREDQNVTSGFFIVQVLPGGPVRAPLLALIRRGRLDEAAEQARLPRDVDWAELTVRLSYSDQAHLSRDFSARLGMPLRQYGLACRRYALAWRAAASSASRSRPPCSSSSALAASGASR
jgi:AraC-like DNA-binding protein